MDSVAALVDPVAVRREKAERVKRAPDLKFPRLKMWNYDPCKWHDETKTDCEYQQCGGDFFSHQRVGIAWQMLVERGILADVPGAGKTNQILGLAALLKEKGELTQRGIIICQAPAVQQWVAEANRWVPKLHVEPALGTKAQRRARYYQTNFDLLVIGYQMLLKDLEDMCRLEFGLVVSDDVDPLRNGDTQTARAIKRLARDAQRVTVINATPMQIKLEEMYESSVPVGGAEIFGSKRAFERRFVQQESTYFWNPRTGRRQTRLVTVGYKNGNLFKELLSPLYLRREYGDLKDVRMPAVQSETVWLDLHPLQRSKYEELQEGVLKLISEEGEKIKYATALTKVTYGQQLCAGMPALGEPDGPEASVKLDWLFEQLSTNWADQKVIAYVKNVGMVRAVEARAKQHGKTVAKIWGAESTDREQERLRFWRDPKCQIAVGTSAMERSLNLQCASIVVNVDTLLNPARMTQILGRARRAGSKADTVWCFTLLTRDTQEDRYLQVLKERQALVDFVWDTENELYEKLTPLQLMKLIRP